MQVNRTQYNNNFGMGFEKRALKNMEIEMKTMYQSGQAERAEECKEWIDLLRKKSGNIYTIKYDGHFMILKSQFPGYENLEVLEGFFLTKPLEKKLSKAYGYICKEYAKHKKKPGLFATLIKKLKSLKV